MSRRHQSNRRKIYGRRQHEVRERHDRDQPGQAYEPESGDWGATAQADPLGFLDLRTRGVRFALGD